MKNQQDKRKREKEVPVLILNPIGKIDIQKTDLEAATTIDTMKIRTIRKNEKEFIETMINDQSPSLMEGLFTFTKN